MKMDQVSNLPQLEDVVPNNYSIFKEISNYQQQNPTTTWTSNCKSSPCLSSSKVKILLRGDFLGALNCMFPDLQLIPSDVTGKLPILDQNFSLFSETNEELEEIFASAKIYRSYILENLKTRKTMLKLRLEEILQNELIDNAVQFTKPNEAQTNVDSMPADCLRAPNCSPPPPMYGDTKSLTRNRCGHSVHFEDEYITFVEHSLADRYPSKAIDFKRIETIIASLDHDDQVQCSSVTKIAPFNSNLPVLNISQYTPPPVAIAVLPNLTPKTKEKLVHSNTNKKPLDSGRLGAAKTDKILSSVYRSSSDRSAKKSTTKKIRKRIGAKRSGASNCCSVVDHSVISVPRTRLVEAEPSFDCFANDLDSSLAAIMQSSFESLSSNGTVAMGVTETVLSPNEHSSDVNSDPIDAATNSKIILRDNIENLLWKNMENLITHQQLIQRQCELRTLYLRQKLNVQCASCDALRDVSLVFSEDLMHADPNRIGSMTLADSLSELEKEAMQQYRNSDESMEEKFAALEREAQEQYLT